MPRTCTPAERAIISALDVQHLLYLFVADADGVLQDCADLGALHLDFADGASWGEELDTAISTGQLVIRRDTDADSAAPTMGDSSINRDTLGAFAPLFEKGRAVLVKVATVLPGVAPVEVDKKPMFIGRINTVQWNADPMTISISDVGAWLVDASLPEQKQYASASSTPGEGMLLGAMIQSMIDDAIPPAGSVPLYEPAIANWEPYSATPQDPGSLFAAIQQWAQEIGWNIRYRFDAADNFRLTLFEPPRTKVDPDWTFGPDEYTKVTNLTSSISDIRNRVKVLYQDADGKLQSVTAEDPVSIAKYGGPNAVPRLWQFASATIRDETTALALANAVLSDLSEAQADQELELPFFWPVQIGDMGLFLANGDHYDTDQLLAVIAYQHSFKDGEGVTTIRARGRVAGAFKQWVARPQTVPGLPVDTRSLAFINFREVRRTPTAVTYGWDKISGDPAEIWEWDKLTPQDADPPIPPGADDDRLWHDIKVDAPTKHLDISTTELEVEVPPFGSIQTVEIQPVDADLKRGFSQRVKVLSAPDIPRITSLETVEGATGLFRQITALNVTDPQALGGTLKVWLKYTLPEDADPALVPDGTITVASTPYVFGPTDAFVVPAGGTQQLFDAIRIHPGAGKHIYFEFINSQGISSGIISFVLLSNGGIITPDGILKDASINLASQIASGFSLPSVYTTLPGSGRPNELALQTSDMQLYRWSGSSWTAQVPAPNITGVLTASQIADHIIDINKVASSLAPPEVLGSLPASPGAGRTALYNGELYRSKTDGTGWTKAVQAPDISGQLVTAQLATGAVTNAIIAAGAVTSTTIADNAITTPKILAGAVVTASLAAGSVTTAIIAAGNITTATLAAGAVTTSILAAGAVTTATIAANAVTAGTIAAGAVSTTQLAASAVTANEIAAGAVTTVKMTAGTINGDRIAANTLDASKIVANSITASQIAANSLTAGTIQAGAITATAIAAGAVDATKLSTIVLSETAPNAGIIQIGKLRSIDGLRYLDLAATGTNSFLHTPSMDLRADGSATFSGTVSSSVFTATAATFSGSLAASGGIFSTGTSSTNDGVFLGNNIATPGIRNGVGSSNLYLRGAGNAIPITSIIGNVLKISSTSVTNPVPGVMISSSAPSSPGNYQEGDLWLQI
jgi:hypothetical protein